jgi:steroid 5-alpha reductase family enzyme
MTDNKELTPSETLMQTTSDGWKTLGTMMFTELLWSLRDDVEPHVLAKHKEQTEDYRLLMVRQTKIALKMRDQETSEEDTNE